MDNLKGNYDEERISSMAVGIDIKKELEAKLHPSYADRSVLVVLPPISFYFLHIVMRLS